MLEYKALLLLGGVERNRQKKDEGKGIHEPSSEMRFASLRHVYQILVL
jgi:hypothetical protein